MTYAHAEACSERPSTYGIARLTDPGTTQCWLEPSHELVIVLFSEKFNLRSRSDERRGRRDGR